MSLIIELGRKATPKDITLIYYWFMVEHTGELARNKNGKTIIYAKPGTAPLGPDSFRFQFTEKGIRIDGPRKELTKLEAGKIKAELNKNEAKEPVKQRDAEDDDPFVILKANESIKDYWRSEIVSLLRRNFFFDYSEVDPADDPSIYVLRRDIQTITVEFDPADTKKITINAKPNLLAGIKKYRKEAEKEITMFLTEFDYGRTVAFFVSDMEIDRERVVDNLSKRFFRGDNTFRVYARSTYEGSDKDGEPVQIEFAGGFVLIKSRYIKSLEGIPQVREETARLVGAADKNKLESTTIKLDRLATRADMFYIWGKCFPGAEIVEQYETKITFEDKMTRQKIVIDINGNEIKCNADRTIREIFIKPELKKELIAFGDSDKAQPPANRIIKVIVESEGLKVDNSVGAPDYDLISFREERTSKKIIVRIEKNGEVKVSGRLDGQEIYEKDEQLLRIKTTAEGALKPAPKTTPVNEITIKVDGDANPNFIDVVHKLYFPELINVSRIRQAVLWKATLVNDDDSKRLDISHEPGKIVKIKGHPELVARIHENIEQITALAGVWIYPKQKVGEELQIYIGAANKNYIFAAFSLVFGKDFGFGEGNPTKRVYNVQGKEVKLEIYGNRLKVFTKNEKVMEYINEYKSSFELNVSAICEALSKQDRPGVDKIIERMHIPRFREPINRVANSFGRPPNDSNGKPKTRRLS